MTHQKKFIKRRERNQEKLKILHTTEDFRKVYSTLISILSDKYKKEIEIIRTLTGQTFFFSTHLNFKEYKGKKWKILQIKFSAEGHILPDIYYFKISDYLTSIMQDRRIFTPMLKDLDLPEEYYNSKFVLHNEEMEENQE